MQKQTSIAVLGLALFLAVPASAQTQTGTIRVHVTVPGTQAPIPGVQLSLVAPQSPSTLDLPDNETELLAYLRALAEARGLVAANQQRAPLAVAGVTQGVVASTVTDAEGNAVFGGLQPGKYSVRATREGYVAPPNNGGVQSPPSAGFTSNVDAVGSAVDIPMFLNPGATISGRVQTSDGKGVPNVSVTLGTIQLVGGQRTFVAGIAAVVADASGEYRLPLVGPGEYAIRATSSGAATYFPGTYDLQKATLLLIEAPRNPIEAGRNIVNVDIVLP